MHCDGPSSLNNNYLSILSSPVAWSIRCKYPLPRTRPRWDSYCSLRVPTLYSVQKIYSAYPTIFSIAKVSATLRILKLFMLTCINTKSPSDDYCSTISPGLCRLIGIRRTCYWRPVVTSYFIIGELGL